MHFINRPFAISVSTFGVGTVTGFLFAALFPAFRGAMTALLQVRVLAPLHSAMTIGGAAVVVLIFTNNAVPVLLSFLYPLLLARIPWTPPLTRNRTQLLLTGYSVLAAFLLGFLDLGATLGSILFERGASFVSSLLSHSWLHGPIEFILILLAISEPAWIASRQTSSGLALFERKDGVLLFSCLLGLLASAILEFALNV
jgi:hypothetical protein